VQQDVVDVDVQYALRSRFGAVQNTLQVGLNYRMKHISWNYLDQDHTLHHGALYLQDTLRLSDRFSAVASIRMDRHPVLPGPVFSPRGSLIFRPTEGRAIRVSGGTAFRTPTMMELYLQFQNHVPTAPGVSVEVCGGEVMASHCRRLDAESGLSFDVGYLDQTLDRVQFEANFFWTRGTNLITLAEVDINPIGSSNVGTGRTVSLGGAGFRNEPAATYVFGAEFGARVVPLDGLDVYANYTLALTAHEAGGFLAGGAGVPGDQRTPMHKVNAGVQLRTRFGLDVELFGHFASRQVWLEQVFDTTRGIVYSDFAVPDYFVLNGRVGYRLLNDRLDVGVVGTNLTDTRTTTAHREHPFGTPQALRVMATANYRF
jgi:iron complex outermembrane receptor protein